MSAGFQNTLPGRLLARDLALSIPDKGALVVAARPADDGTGAVVALLDALGQGRTVGIWPAAFAFGAARRTSLVEMDGDAIAVGADRRAAVDVAPWGVAAARLFTSRESPG